MKYLKIILPSIFLLMMNCTAQESSKEFEVIEYEAQTRGSLITIKVLNSELSYKSNNKEGKHKLSSKEINELSNTIKSISLKAISTLKAPSERRITDGALHAEFNIKAEGKKFRSITFDAGNPPIELKKLEDLLYQLAKLTE